MGPRAAVCVLNQNLYNCLCNPHVNLFSPWDFEHKSLTSKAIWPKYGLNLHRTYKSWLYPNWVSEFDFSIFFVHIFADDDLNQSVNKFRIDSSCWIGWRLSEKWWFWMSNCITNYETHFLHYLNCAMLLTVGGWASHGGHMTSRVIWLCLLYCF